MLKATSCIAILTLISSVSHAQTQNYMTGSEYADGYTFDEMKLLKVEKVQESDLSSGTGASERKDKVEKLSETQKPKTQADYTARKVMNQPVMNPARTFQSMLNAIGRDVSPIQPVQTFPVQNRRVKDRVTFDPKDFVNFTALEPATVNGVNGYLGTASSGGVIIRGADGRPQEYFIAQADYNSMNPSEYQDMLQTINGTNDEIHHHDDDCEHNKDPYDEPVVPQVKVPRVNGYLPGCQALAANGGPEAKHHDQLKQCLQSIKEAVASVSRKGGAIDRDLWMCNVMAQLNPKEQEFAGMLFTSVGEGSVFLTSDGTSEPRYKELAFIMKTMDNRTRLLKQKLGNEYTAIDVALAPWQFSIYNSSKFNKFRHHFEPNSRRSDKAFDGAIKAFVALKQGTKIQPQPQVDEVYNYYNPNGMAKGSSSNRSSLIRQGKIPGDHPSNRKVPKWNFANLDMLTSLNFDGRAVRKNPPYRHVFYTQKNPGDEFGNRTKIRERRNRCPGKPAP